MQVEEICATDSPLLPLACPKCKHFLKPTPAEAKMENLPVTFQTVRTAGHFRNAGFSILSILPSFLLKKSKNTERVAETAGSFS